MPPARIIRVVRSDVPTGRWVVFVSHSSQDTWVARQIAREIEATGASVFLDETHVDAGADFEDEILDWLERADELVVLLTPWALDRPYVWSELGAVWGRRKSIVAVLHGITPTELQNRPGTPVYLKKRNMLALNDVGKYVEELKERVRRHADGASDA
jgi:hypothetical protein